ncbi:non-specific lipid transfer protein GPI-anchored 14-like [Vicia villosa]|uniref:non-specific lipid transfer protein GPI-anchored 14-like n=1 Tax=Vicia villosa TaxID=3911 RepID=UPI00273C1A7E|nr:non-specific lipid transfer protein GPI-anchored 14-like [Vicia villosa]XP_058748833.1 non-specific lipid transfer protein GPI-anchored 14-like [Vicia villosa]
MLHHNTNSMVHFLLLASMIIGIGMSDSSKDKQECTEQLASLATCLPYVEGEGKTPATDCCDGLKTLLKTNEKCLCLIIKDRNDPDLGGIVINVTLALNLPKVCNAPANVSRCPELLHMDPKSAEAQVFYQLKNGSTNIGPSAAPSPSDGASTHANSTTEKSDAFSKEKNLFGLQVLAVGISVWFLLGSTDGNIFKIPM